ncbi:hypothetical protein ACFSCZ_17475 [Siminovitchia sediminis]|uniref:Integral membrane protein n=1 Tax=Siminovitchia sediminis TaxID=1274353 RepID=A0ABW4KMQ0_9BACI|nr:MULTISPECIES: hypothetical protein [Bacillaceae]KKB41390.1 hypothetical protein QY96_02053 [Bacillus thermotolerans]
MMEMMDFLMQYKWLIVIIAEILFLVFAGLFFIMRYWFRKNAVGFAFIILLILNELFLAFLAIYDYLQTGTLDSFQIITAIFYIYLIFEGKKDFKRLDHYFKKKVASWKGETVPDLQTSESAVEKKYGRAHAKEEREGWYIHLVIFVIAQIVFWNIDNFTGWQDFNLNQIGEFFQIYEDPKINQVNAVWGVILFIDFIWSFSYTIWPKKEKSSSKK